MYSAKDLYAQLHVDEFMFKSVSEHMFIKLSSKKNI